MKKFIPARIVNDSCHNCPYMEYDSFYSMSTDSGYYCTHEDGKGQIASDSQIDQYKKKQKEAERLPLFPEKVEDPNPMSIPDWCPLEDYKDNKDKIIKDIAYETKKEEEYQAEMKLHAKIQRRVEREDAR